MTVVVCHSPFGLLYTVLDSYQSNGTAHRLSDTNSNTTTNSRSISSAWKLGNHQSDQRADENMRRVRLQQQQALDRQAKEARQNEKVNPTEPKKKKKTVVRPLSAGYNPMQPWNSGSGGGYKYVAR